eukprot:12665921-Prorocentrum_lima.AAC.1
MAQLCEAILDSSSKAFASRLTSVICPNCTLGKFCPGCCAEADEPGAIIISSVRTSTSSSS